MKRSTYEKLIIVSKLEGKTIQEFLKEYTKITIKEGLKCQSKP